MMRQVPTPRWIAGLLALGMLGLGAACGGVGASGQDRAALVERGKSLFTVQGCYGCHTVGKMGTPIAPDLSTVGRKYSEVDLARWLADPAAERPMRHMPEIELAKDDAGALAAYLGTLR